jgi:hypothetical protein
MQFDYTRNIFAIFPESLCVNRQYDYYDCVKPVDVCLYVDFETRKEDLNFC